MSKKSEVESRKWEDEKSLIKNQKMKIKKIIPLAFFFIVMVACTNRPEGVIPPEKIIPIIEDVHLTDAVLTNSRQRRKMSEKEGYYAYIYKKHNITREDFDKSMEYYAHNPKELRETYVDILKRLGKRDSIVKVRAKARIDTVDLWEGKNSYQWEKFTTETLPVCMPVEYLKTYKISAEIKVFKDAQVKEVTPYFIFDGLDSVYVLKTKTFKADTIFQPFEITSIVSDSTIFDLAGDFFPNKKEGVEEFKHYEIRNIRITTTRVRTEAEIDSILLKQDSVRLVK